MHSIVTIINKTVLDIWNLLKGVNLTVLTTRKKTLITMCGDGQFRPIVMIISHYAHILNHYVVHLKLTKDYVSIISQEKYLNSLFSYHPISLLSFKARLRKTIVYICCLQFLFFLSISLPLPLPPSLSLSQTQPHLSSETALTEVTNDSTLPNPVVNSQASWPLKYRQRLTHQWLFSLSWQNFSSLPGCIHSWSSSCPLDTSFQSL